MNKRQASEAKAILGAKEFTANLVAQFTHTPPTKVDEKFAAARARLTQSVTDLGGKQSIQSGGAYGEESDRQKDLRGQVEDFLGDINDTAAAIAADTEDPALMNRFRMPGDGGDTGLAATGLGMVAAIRELSLNDEFEGHGYGPDTATDLETLVLAFKGSVGGQGTALIFIHKSGAVAGDCRAAGGIPDNVLHKLETGVWMGAA